MASSQTPPRKKAAMMVRWKRSPPLLDDPPPPTATAAAAAAAQPKDMEDLFCLPKAQSTQSPDAASDLLFMQWIAASSAVPLVTPFSADLLLEQACLLAEEKALQDRRVGQLPPKSNSSIRTGLYARYLIVSRPVASEDSVRMMAECLDGEGESDSEDKDSRLIQLVLRGCWTECKFPEAADGGGCVVHVCFTKPPEATNHRVLVVDDDHHLLVIHPDQLVSPTKIADATGCARRVVLKNQFSSSANSSGKDAVFGQVKHALVQRALVAWRFDLEFLSGLVPPIVSQHSNTLFACEVTEMEAREVLFAGMEALRDWGERFTRGEGIAVEFSPGKWETIRLVRVLGVECEVTSGMFGMKGIMDGVCVVERQNGTRAVMPLEIKTGKPLLRSEHKAQTMMYCLMLADRFAVGLEGGVEHGLLLQASFGAGDFKLIGVAVRHAELKELIRIRNSLTVGLPPVVPMHECQRCFQRDLCAFVDLPNHSEHFVRWRDVMAREEEHQNRNRGFRPYQPSKFSITNLTLRESNMGLLLFHSESALVHCGLQPEDYVTLSLQHAHYGVLGGVVQQVGPDTLLVRCEDETQDFRTSASVLWAVEKKTYAFANPIGNLVDLMLAEDGHKQKIRQLLTDPAAAPQYWDSEFNPFIRNAKRPLLEHCLGNSMEHLRRDLARFGKSPPPAAMLTRRVDLSAMTCDQVQAVASVLAAKDYVCILGAPGAGKTFLLSRLVQLLSTQLGKSVLVVSHTNTALDHLLMKIDSPHVVRIGVKSSVRPELHSRLLPSTHCPTELLESHLHNPQLVAGVTCFAAGKHALFQRKQFDYCILDEASQVTELHMLAAWFCGRVLVAVGDPLQLPPLVATTQGNVESVLEVLARKRNAISVQLTTQFRMNEDLNFLANRLFYGDALQCGTEEVEMQRLALASGAWTTAQEQWLARAVSPEQTICFCDTDGLGRDLELRCEGDEGGISNPTECQVVARIVEQLHVRGELAVDQIGIISPYRAQLAELRLALSDVADVEIDTVDKYQGREKACIVVSLVRSNASGQVGSLLADYRRLNVAFSRARCKLVVIGSRSTLVHNPRLREFISVVQERDWLVRVEKV